jgi:hypothetical protein
MNAGTFRPGHDPRRHAFTADECREGGRRGFARLMADKPHLLLWLKKQLRRRGRFRRAGPEDQPCTT